MFKNIKKNKGFTLIEILVVIGIIAILAAIVIIAINPAKQFAQARNTERTAGVTSILNAVGQRIADNKGVFKGEFDVNGTKYRCGALPVNPNEQEITTNMPDLVDIDDETGDLGCLVPTYISALPSEPLGTGTGISQYTIEVNSLGRVTVCAPEAADEKAVPGAGTICITR